MDNFNNILKGIKENDVMVQSACETLQEKYSKKVALDLLFYLKCKHRYDIVLRLILGLFKDKQFEIEFVKLFFDILKYHFPYEKWEEYSDELMNIILNNEYAIGQEQLKVFAYTLEILYAKGTISSRTLLTTVFSYINEPDNSFGILNQETVIIRAAKAAYACNQYNIKNKIAELNNTKIEIDKQGLKGLKRIVNYYLGLCHEKVLNDKQTNYIKKSSEKGFLLANLYIEHIKFNFEASKKVVKSA